MSTYKSDTNINQFNSDKISSGYQTNNILFWNDFEYQNFITNSLLEIISKNLNVDKNSIEYFWNHFLEYQNGGKMDLHKHFHNEDFVIFIYLKTCKTGQTIFYLNDYSVESKKRTSIELLPISGTGAIFSSLVLHEGKFTTENKRIFVVGVKIKTY